MYKLPAESVDMIFADPPYNLQLSDALYRPNMTEVQGVHDAWDQFLDFKHYDLFTYEWLHACQHVLKKTGTIWVIGSYHNIYRVGTIMMDLGFWILNDIVWIKANPMPNFRGVRFTNAHETLIWAKTSQAQRSYTFNHHAMKAFNEGKQSRSDWEIPECAEREWSIPLCPRSERLLKEDGTKLHSTQKPEALLERVVMASTKLGDVVLDPFFGTGTTGVAAKRLGRHWIGIERDREYADAAEKRVRRTQVTLGSELQEREELDIPKKRIAFARLLEAGLLHPGASLTHKRTGDVASVNEDGTISAGEETGSIHRVGARVAGAPACNGWATWLYEDEHGHLTQLDELRQMIRDRDASNS